MTHFSSDAYDFSTKPTARRSFESNSTDVSRLCYIFQRLETKRLSDTLNGSVMALFASQDFQIVLSSRAYSYWQEKMVLLSKSVAIILILYYF